MVVPQRRCRHAPRPAFSRQAARQADPSNAVLSWENSNDTAPAWTAKAALCRCARFCASPQSRRVPDEPCVPCSPPVSRCFRGGRYVREGMAAKAATVGLRCVRAGVTPRTGFNIAIALPRPGAEPTGAARSGGGATTEQGSVLQPANPVCGAEGQGLPPGMRRSRYPAHCERPTISRSRRPMPKEYRKTGPVPYEDAWLCENGCGHFRWARTDGGLSVTAA